MTASTKTTKITPNKISFSEDNFIWVDRPGAQRYADALGHFPFKSEFIYVIRYYV